MSSTPIRVYWHRAFFCKDCLNIILWIIDELSAPRMNHKTWTTDITLSGILLSGEIIFDFCGKPLCLCLGESICGCESRLSAGFCDSAEVWRVLLEFVKKTREISDGRNTNIFTTLCTFRNFFLWWHDLTCHFNSERNSIYAWVI